MTRRGTDINTDYKRQLRLAPSLAKKAFAVALLLLFLLAPLQLRDFPLSVLNLAGVFVIGAIGLNLLTGFTGQVSLGHAFFMAIGAYTWAHFGGEQDWPLWAWLLLAAVIGGLVGALIGPFALRLRGNYLAIVSLGLVFLGLHIWKNWKSVTGGGIGFSGEKRGAYLGPIDFENLSLFGQDYSIYQSFFWLIWFVVGVGLVVAKNIVRSRPGRAMQAVRDRDVAAAVIGVNLARYKIAAFAISSAYAAVAGALYGSYYNYVNPDHWNLLLSIQFIAVIIVGGVGTIFGAVLGGVFIGSLPSIISANSDKLGFIERVGISVPELNAILFGLVIVVFLVLEPHGLAGIWFRIRAYFKTWPFSY
jgi:branched-chain amino acid transport system permease protein